MDDRQIGDLSGYPGQAPMSEGLMMQLNQAVTELTELSSLVRDKTTPVRYQDSEVGAVPEEASRNVLHEEVLRIRRVNRTLNEIIRELDL